MAPCHSNTRGHEPQLPSKFRYAHMAVWELTCTGSHGKGNGPGRSGGPCSPMPTFGIIRLLPLPLAEQRNDLRLPVVRSRLLPTPCRPAEFKDGRCYRDLQRRDRQTTGLHLRQCNSASVTLPACTTRTGLNAAECSGTEIRNLADAGPLGSPRVASDGILDLETWAADDCSQGLPEPCRSRTLFWGLQSGRSIVEKGECRKRTTPTPAPAKQDPLAGWPLALALPQKSPRPRLSLSPPPHRAVQILDTPTCLPTPSPSLPAASSQYLLLLSFLGFPEAMARFRCEKLDSAWPRHRQHARAAGISPTIMNRDQTRAQVGCSAPLHCHLHMLTPHWPGG